MKKLSIVFNDETSFRKIETLMNWITRLTDLMGITCVQIYEPEADQAEAGDEQA